MPVTIQFMVKVLADILALQLKNSIAVINLVINSVVNAFRGI